MNEITCGICGSSKPLVPHRDRPNRKCQDCGSLLRQRKFWDFVENSGILDGADILYVAPEYCLANKVRQRSKSCFFIDLFDDKKLTSKADITDLTAFADGTFDLVVCSHVLEHIVDDARALDELTRVTKKQGTLMLSVPMAGASTRPWTEEEIQDQKDKGLWGLPGKYPGHYRTYGHRDLTKELQTRFSSVGLTGPSASSEDYFICKK